MNFPDRLGAVTAVKIWLILLTAPVLSAWAHHGAEKAIARLDGMIARAKTGPEKASLLRRRAGEYRILGQRSLARQDLEQALRNEPSDASSRLLLCRVLLEADLPSEAIRAAEATRTHPSDALDLAALSMCEAEARIRLEEFEAAAAACRRAVAGVAEPRIEWILLESEILRRLNRPGRRLELLEEARRRNPSYVVRLAWMDAVIDCGRGGEILAEVESEIRSGRLRSAWYLRRGRIRESLNRAGAEKDYRAALAELETTISSEAPDRGLLLRQAEASARLGRVDEAAEIIDRCRRVGMEPWRLAAVKALIRAAR